MKFVFLFLIIAQVALSGVANAANSVRVQMLCVGNDEQGIAQHRFGFIFSADGRTAQVYHLAADIRDGSDPQIVDEPFIAIVKKKNEASFSLHHESSLHQFDLQIEKEMFSQKTKVQFVEILAGEGYSAKQMGCLFDQILRYNGKITFD